MLLSLLVLSCDWCYCHLLFSVIDVIITLYYLGNWQMLCHVVWHHFTIARGHWNLPMADVVAIFDLLG